MGRWGLRARRSFGNKYFRVTASKSGLSYSLGAPGMRRTWNVLGRQKGRVTDTVTIPGTGISWRRSERAARRRAAQPAPSLGSVAAAHQAAADPNAVVAHQAADKIQAAAVAHQQASATRSEWYSSLGRITESLGTCMNALLAAAEPLDPAAIREGAQELARLYQDHATMLAAAPLEIRNEAHDLGAWEELRSRAASTLAASSPDGLVSAMNDFARELHRPELYDAQARLTAAMERVTG